jgi:hypothetical protein
MTQFRVRHDSVQDVAWLSSARGVAQLGYGVNQHRVWRGSVKGCDVAQLRMGRGSVEYGAWLSKGVAWLSRVRRGKAGCSVAK